MIKTSLLVASGLVALALILPQQIGFIGGVVAAPASSGQPSGPPPSSPPPDQPDPGNPTPGPDLPEVPKDEKIQQMAETCNAALADLAKVPEKLVVDFANPNGVSVVPVCNSGVGREAHIDPSQALPLQKAIANNPALLASLQARGFSADDVVGVVLIDGVATLYVHKGA